MGASDPTSGTTSVHEIVEGLAVLLDKGWKPLRTIMFASWDAEEYGVIGSTEWGEDFPHWIESHVVAYLNVDNSAGGSRFHISASPSLAHLLRSSAESVPHPIDPERTLWDANKDAGPFTERPGMGIMSPDEARKFRDERVAWIDEQAALRSAIYARAKQGSPGDEVSMADDMDVGALGSGSDYLVFLLHIGVASMDGGFDGTAGDAVFHSHSVYDSITWMERYGDPGYHRSAAVAKYVGLAALRISDSIILPINTTQYAYELLYYLSLVEDVASSGSFDFDFSELREAISSLQQSSLALDSEKKQAEAELIQELKKYMEHHRPGKYHSKLHKLLNAIKRVFGVTPSWHPRVPKSLVKAAKRVRKINKQLSSFERAFISPQGLRRRGWYKNMLIAQEWLLGYGATTLPGLTEAFTIDKSAEVAKVEADRLVELVKGAAEGLKVKAERRHSH